KDQLLERHQESAIYLMIRQEDFDWVTMVEQLSYVKKVENERNGFKIHVHHLEEDAQRLLQYAIDSNVMLLKFEMGIHESLEEIFLELVV
ncbi:MAG TPA: ABC transporter ATP-binding protein, partial [Lysinibacillus sp.]|nr:ABC transporter ATP-binding protein [Lysinibacillus sp.]